VLGFQFSGIANEKCPGGLGGPLGGMTSSTTTGGGALSLSLRRREAIAMARSKIFFCLRLDSAAYQAAPRRGLPRIRGMTGTLRES
jgi:hypothetical protein